MNLRFWHNAKAEQEKNPAFLDAIRGCLIGGAAGDALGYSVEFVDDVSIFEEYGPKGITQYSLDHRTGKALISDDTQMTLFTANGLLVADTQACLGETGQMPRGYVERAYQDWLYTQYGSCEERNKRGPEKQSWLCDVPELYRRRAPGNTCLSALENAMLSRQPEDYIKIPRNNSKGCGGIMRIAPVALQDQPDIKQLDMEAAQIAAITHGHSLGYMPAAVLCHIIHRIVFPQKEKLGLLEIVVEARDTVSRIFRGDKHLKKMIQLIDEAMDRSQNTLDDLENIRALGEGWVAEETLAIAIYCSLKYEKDFSAGIIAAVNHSGDSDSTGAVTGNILGAIAGYEAIADPWEENLECADVILEIADDLYYGCPHSETDLADNADWQRKYRDMCWKSAH